MKSIPAILKYYFLPAVIFTAITTGTLILYAALEKKEVQEIAALVEQEADTINTLLSIQTHAKLHVLEGMAARWIASEGTPVELWRSDVEQHLRWIPSLRVMQWADATYHVRWVEPLAGNENALGLYILFDETRKNALQGAANRAVPTLTPPIDLVQGYHAFIAYVPLWIRGQFDGFIVGIFAIDEFFLDIPNLKHGGNYHYTLSYEDRTFFKSDDDTTTPVDKGWDVERTVQIYDKLWKLRVEPSAKFVAQATNSMPVIVLISGLLIAAFSTTIIIFFAREATANKALASLNTRLHSITDNLPVLIGYLNAQRQYMFINRTGEEWYARSADQILNRTTVELIGEPFTIDTPGFIGKLHQGPFRTEATRKYPDGVTRTVESALIPDHDPDGTLRGYFRLGTDITARKRAEDELRHFQSIEAVGQLTGGIAHDFNNLLMVIGGNLELLDDRLGDQPSLHALAEKCRNAVGRGTTLTRSLLAFSAQQPLHPAVVDIRALLSDLEVLIRRTLPESIELQIVAAEDLWTCEIDVGQLQNALLNLIVNARDAMPDGGQLTIGLANTAPGDRGPHAEGAPSGAFVEISVSDTGHGMSEDVAAKAFEPFFTTKDVGKGSGLGLSMVYGFVNQSKGHVSIQSTVGVGTVVRLYFPRAELKNKDVHPVSKVDRPLVSPIEGKTILVIEDDDDIRSLTVSMLRSVGFTVLSADRATSAFQICQTNSTIDVLLSDLVLPGSMNGRVIAEELLHRRPALKVLYMSGYTDDIFVNHLKGASNVGLLQKPFDKSQLISRITSLLAS